MGVFNMKVSEHFKSGELACRCCNRLFVDDVFLSMLEELRLLWGKPMIVTSCFRCAKHNREVGGAENSFHLYGCAADIFIKKEDQKYFCELACRIGFSHIFAYEERNFVHIDSGGIE